MHRSSDAIGQLAGALAKAQAELVNPIKSLTGQLEPGRGTLGGATFRYAPLSAGLDVIRKSLGKHEIAVLQATDVDRDTALVMLTTTLAHGSGEWVAARWPVCRVADLSNPKLMGAALTYARRFGLFALAGLAGEDDLDAPPRSSSGRSSDHASPDDAEPDAGPNAVIDPAEESGPALASSPDRAGLNERPVLARGRFAQPQAALRRASHGRMRGRVGHRTPASTIPATAAADSAAPLDHITDAESLLAWAATGLSVRNGLDHEARAALDAAFLARVGAIGGELALPTEATATDVQASPIAPLSDGDSNAP